MQIPGWTPQGFRLHDTGCSPAETVAGQTEVCAGLDASAREDVTSQKALHLLRREPHKSIVWKVLRGPGYLSCGGLDLCRLYPTGS